MKTSKKTKREQAKETYFGNIEETYKDNNQRKTLETHKGNKQRKPTNETNE